MQCARSVLRARRPRTFHLWMGEIGNGDKRNAPSDARWVHGSGGEPGGGQARVSHSVPTEPPRRQAPDMFGTGTERLYAVAPSLSSCDGDCSSRVSPVRGCTRRLLMALAGITSSRWECATAVPASGHTTSAPAKTHSADSCMPNLHIARRSLCGSLSRVE